MGLIKYLLFTFSSRLVLFVMLSHPPNPFVFPFFHTHIFEDGGHLQKQLDVTFGPFFLKLGVLDTSKCLCTVPFHPFTYPEPHPT